MHTKSYLKNCTWKSLNQSTVQRKVSSMLHVLVLCSACLTLQRKKKDNLNTSNKWNELICIKGHPGPTRTYTSDPGLSGPGERVDFWRECWPLCPRLKEDRQRQHQRVTQLSSKVDGKKKVHVKWNQNSHYINSEDCSWLQFTLSKGEYLDVNTQQMHRSVGWSGGTHPWHPNGCTGHFNDVYSDK